MSLLSELLDLPGVVAAGNFAYRGDQYAYVGQISDAEARALTILCRSNLESIRMQGNMLQMLTTVCRPGAGECGLQAGKGWLSRGPERSVCVISNTFCILDNAEASVNAVLHLMLNRLADAPDILV